MGHPPAKPLETLVREAGRVGRTALEKHPMIKTFTAISRQAGSGDFDGGAVLAAGATRVCVNRVARVRSGSADFETVVEAWWTDAAEARRGAAAVASQDELRFACVVDERAFDVHGRNRLEPIPAGAFKILYAYRLPPGLEGEAFWRYHAETHGPEVVAAAGDLLVGYSLNRRVETTAGSAGFFALIELWWASEAAAAAYAERSASYVTASGKSPLEDFMSYGTIAEFALLLAEEG